MQEFQSYRQEGSRGAAVCTEPIPEWISHSSPDTGSICHSAQTTLSSFLNLIFFRLQEPHWIFKNGLSVQIGHMWKDLCDYFNHFSEELLIEGNLKQDCSPLLLLMKKQRSRDVDGLCRVVRVKSTSRVWSIYGGTGGCFSLDHHQCCSVVLDNLSVLIWKMSLLGYSTFGTHSSPK